MNASGEEYTVENRLTQVLNDKDKRTRALEEAVHQLISCLVTTQHAWENRLNIVSCQGLTNSNASAIERGRAALHMKVDK